jgi:hypothetical protein
MRVLTATWYDNFNQPFLTEFYEEFFKEDQILDFYAEQKSIYGRKVIASYPDTRVFSDGTRVIVQLCQVKSKIEQDSRYNPEEIIDVDANEANYLPGFAGAA